MRTRGDKATGHTLLVLHLLKREGDALTNNEISEKTGIPVSTVGKILYNQRNKVPSPIIQVKKDDGQIAHQFDGIEPLGDLPEELQAVLDHGPEALPSAMGAQRRGRGSSGKTEGTRRRRVQKTASKVRSTPARTSGSPSQSSSDPREAVIASLIEVPQTIKGLARSTGLAEEDVRGIVNELHRDGMAKTEKIMNDEIVAYSGERYEQPERPTRSSAVKTKLPEEEEALLRIFKGRPLSLSTIYRKLGANSKEDRAQALGKLNTLIDRNLVMLDNSTTPSTYVLAEGGAQAPADQPAPASTGAARATEGAVKERTVSARTGRTGRPAAKDASGAGRAGTRRRRTSAEEPTESPAPRAQPESLGGAPSAAASEQAQALISSIQGLTERMQQRARVEPQGKTISGNLTEIAAYVEALEAENQFWRVFAEEFVEKLDQFARSSFGAPR